MQVFISWSGELSNRLGQALRDWLPSTLQYVRPYFTPADIEKGAKWDSEISKQLEDSTVCIIALTRESLDSKWVMFEAGAISRSVPKARVCPILFGIEPTDLQGPLERFQATKFSHADIRRLLITINSNAGEAALADSVLEGVFKKWWPDLETTVTEILSAATPDKSKVRSDKELLEETLLLARSIASQQVTDQQALRQGMQAIVTAFEAIRYQIAPGYGSTMLGGGGVTGRSFGGGSILGSGIFGGSSQPMPSTLRTLASGATFDTVEGLPPQSRMSDPPGPSTDVTKRSDK